ncbi:MAG: cyclic nucleotide-binding domain-containing protein [Candidatus Dadabacteria bacterium]|nr:cyclic nucleotide-binding domain-containing protein [Candidatus Dadabacteria bacterium]NIS07965.1 cyclic nucleotide-binding domain-containing protein [Candidatus Dadabacteria bacterium]NIV43086.1 cyclic nucleotide-binding domain-containing protein [Candidatus Dadabacteria bacterium]NIX14921.1 cyclic nucleotide-binding domain-containing protein [Candidatus Dadabacteria bacterium]NIY21549.1 cyclic nucleotide-binding domain-containing protein [Candidatus Dadabacteria bacterium]
MSKDEVDFLEMFRFSKKYDTYQAGEVIFDKGSDGGVMYIILEGEIEIQVDGSTVGKLFEGQILGEMALVEDQPRSATAIAQTDTKIVPINRETFLLIVKEEPLFALFVMKDLSHKIRVLNQRLIS